ncbi:hypothetical protein BJX70DRAFT_390822 [Aspergillus crustosus]
MTQACTPKPLLDFVRSRRDLLDHTLFWTLKHLDLLGCHFDNKLETSIYSKLAPKDGTSDAEELACHLFAKVKLRSICRLLLGEGRKFARARRGSHFSCQGRPFHWPSYMAFYRYKTPRNSSPPVGLARASRVPGRRQKLIDLTTPEDWREDRYFLFILLALAQRQRSRLLVTHVLQQETILLCEAAITTDLLDALENLKTGVIPITRPIIHRKMIPYKPYGTFAGRLNDELVAPSLSNSTEHVNDATSYEMKRRQEMDDGKDDSGQRKTQRISDT